jgi:hypothetical protein
MQEQARRDQERRLAPALATVHQGLAGRAAAAAAVGWDSGATGVLRFYAAHDTSTHSSGQVRNLSPTLSCHRVA